MKKLLMNSALAVSSLLAITACANTSAVTDTTPYNAMQNTSKSVSQDKNSPFSQLNLTASQQTQIQSIMQNNRGEPMQNHNAVLEILTPKQRTQLNQLMADRMASGQQGQRGSKGRMQHRSAGPGANSPLSQLNLTASQQTQIQLIMQNNRGEPMQNHNAVLEILTPEQRTQLNQLMADRMKSGQQGQGMRRN